MRGSMIAVNHFGSREEALDFRAGIQTHRESKRIAGDGVGRQSGAPVFFLVRYWVTVIGVFGKFVGNPDHGIREIDTRPSTTLGWSFAQAAIALLASGSAKLFRMNSSAWDCKLRSSLLLSARHA